MKVNTISFYCLIDRFNINYLKYIIEAYDNIAVLTTIDPGEGLVHLSVALGCENLVMEIIDDLSRNISIELAGIILSRP